MSHEHKNECLVEKYETYLRAVELAKVWLSKANIALIYIVITVCAYFSGRTKEQCAAADVWYIFVNTSHFWRYLPCCFGS